MPEWTAAQSAAINRRGTGGVVVSAAAGSGKTAVLAERISVYASEGVDLSGLIAVTFTKAAASEIKARVSDVLRKKYAETKNPALRKNIDRIQYAKISTIDSLFKSVVKENFAVLGISPDFGYIDDTEDFAIKNSNLDEILDEYYKTYKNGFAEFTETFGGDKDDSSVKVLINEVYTRALSVPFWKKRFDELLEKYDDPTFFTDAACDIYADILDGYVDVYKRTLESGAVGEDGLAAFNAEFDYMKTAARLMRERKWDDAREALDSSAFGANITKFKLDKESEEKNIFKTHREDFKKRFRDNELLLISSSDAGDDLNALKAGVACLFGIIKEFDEKNAETYEKLNRYPISKVSEYALSLVVSDYDHEMREYVATPLAKKMSRDCFEVIIDEYQDSNDLQDLFFTAISDGAKKLFVVGDVKQSIYKFRHAEPENFNRKARELDCLHLSSNFRSKKGILDFVNFVCSGIFSEKLFENAYSEEDKLSAFRSDEVRADDVEICLIDKPDLKSKDEEEAAFCASEVKRLIRSGYKVFDKQLGEYRPARLGDFAVLLRTGKSLIPIYEKAFSDAGIPAVTGDGASLFSTVEVNVFIALLSVIDNPYDDMKLVAVLLSDLFGFSEDDVATLRLSDRKKSLYENCKTSENSDVRAMLHSLEHFRLLSENMTVDRLVFRIFTETNFLTKVSCGEFGYVKRENMMRFYDFAKKYTDTFSGGLYGFLEFIAASREKESKDSAPLPSGDFVRIMTCHKSKGLEFPICIISSVFKKGVTSSPSYVFDRRFGFTGGKVSEDGKYKYKTLHCEVAKLSGACSDKAEMMRLLYVALTRARDKLIVVGACNVEKLADERKWGASLNGGVPLNRVLKADSLGSLITSALIYHPNIVTDLDFPETRGDNAFSPVTVRKVVPTEDTEPVEISSSVKVDLEKVKENVSFSYDLTASEIPSKLSVTELVKTNYREDNDGDLLISKMPSVRVPEFIEGKRDGTFIGNAMHRFLSFADLEKDFDVERARLISEKRISAKEAAVLKREKIETFKKSAVYAAIKNATEVVREEDFVVSVPASFYSKKANGGDTLLLQGAMDVLCVYGDGVVIIDYKTDRASEEELISKYAYQLFLYSVAAEKMYGLPVKKAYIWSFGLEKGIDVTPFFPEIG